MVEGRVKLKEIHERMDELKPGQTIRLEAENSLVEEPLRLRVEQVVEDEDAFKKYVVATLLHPESNKEGPKVILKHMITNISAGESPDPMVPHLLPHITIAVDEPKGETMGSNVVQLYVPGKPEPERLAKDLAFIFAHGVHYYGVRTIFDVRPENIGKRPFDIATIPTETLEDLEKDSATSPYLAFFFRNFIARTVNKLFDEKERKTFWSRFKKHLMEFLSEREKLDEYEKEERSKLVSLLKRLGYTPRKTMKLG